MSIVNSVSKFLCVLFTLGALTACAGTGTRDKAAIHQQIANATPNTVFVSRSTGFGGSAVRIAIEVDGVVVAQLSNNQVASFELPIGEHFIRAKFRGAAGVTVASATLRYVEDLTKPQFLNVAKKSKLIGAELILSEVSPRSFVGTVW